MTAGLFARPAATQSPAASSPRRAAPPCLPASAAGCHSGDDARAPSPDVLHGRSPQAILDALTAGSMKYQGLALSGEERRANRGISHPRPQAAHGAGGQHDRQLRPLDAARGRAGGGRRLAIPEPARNGTDGDGRSRNTHAQPADQAGLTAEQVPRLHLKWAFRISRCDLGVGAADDRRRPFVHRQPERHRLLARRGQRLHRVDVRGAGRRTIPRFQLDGVRTGYAAYFSDQKGSSTPSMRQRASRSGCGRSTIIRWCVSPDRRRSTTTSLYVPTSSYEEGGKPPGYACCTFRGASSRLMPGAARSSGRANTIAEEPRLLRAYADGTEAARAVGRSDLVGADDRRQAWRALCWRRQHLQWRGAADDGRGAGVRSEDGEAAMVAADGAFDAGRFGCTPGDVNCGERAGPDFDFGASPVLATLASGRQLIVAGQKSGRGLRARPRQEGRAALALSRGRRQRPWRHPMGYRRRQRTRLCAGGRDLQSGARGSACGRSRHGGACLVLAAGDSGLRKAEPRLQRCPVFRGLDYSRHRVLAVERRGRARALDRGRPRGLDLRYETRSSLQSTGYGPGAGR